MNSLKCANISKKFVSCYKNYSILGRILSDYMTEKVESTAFLLTNLSYLTFSTSLA